jgi:hypothetical protein
MRHRANVSTWMYVLSLVEDRDRSAVPFQEAPVETVHALHECYLEMQTRLSDCLPTGRPNCVMITCSVWYAV